MKLTPRDCSNLNHSKPLGSMMLAGSIICTPLEQVHFQPSVPCEMTGF